MPEPKVNRDAKFFIPVSEPDIGPLEIDAVRKVLEKNWVSMGPVNEQFEAEFAAANGKKHGVSCASGTLALQLALMALGVKAGDAVLCPTLTMVATANAILAVGARPTFFDHDYQTNMGIAVHLYGQPAAGLKIGCPIGDCAEAHYACRGFRPLAAEHDFACFSFYANKIITCGEGGMVLTDDDEAAARLRRLRSHAFSDTDRFNHTEYALGCRMTEMQAAIGLCQHQRHELILARRRDIANRFTERLSGVDWLELPPRSAGSVWWVYPLLVKSGAPLSRDQLRAKLAAAGIDTRSYFTPMHRQKHLMKFARYQSFPVADDLAKRGLYLGIYTRLTGEKIDYICEQIVAAV